ncbi:hypothetical protein, partial [Helicobacter suis]|uniref:hypothetical protein n=1 Tax=Helicobacter suis TaxID=104628 RepID=UPI0013D40D7D
GGGGGGGVTSFALTDLAHAQARAFEFNHLKVFLNSAQLQAIEPLILVDMPGYNAPIEAHNKALLRYGATGGGVHFIALVCAATEKIITQSFMRELESIERAHKQFSLALSKTNLVASSDLEEIKQAILEQLNLHFSTQEPLEFLDDHNGAVVLKQMLDRIDSQMLFKRIFHARLELLYTDMRASLQTELKGLHSNQEENQALIQNLQEEMAHIQTQKQQALEQAQSRYANHNLEEILTEVRQALEGNINLLVQIILQGGDFEKEINNIIRPVLLAQIQRKLIGINQHIIEDFQMSVRGVAFEADNLQTWADHLKSFVESSCFAAMRALENKQESKEGFLTNLALASSGTMALQTLGRLGFTINPLVGTLLSTLLSILPGIFSQFVQSKKEEAVREKIANQVIPSILAQIRPDLSAYFSTQVNTIIKETGQAFSEKIAQKQAQIQEIQEQRSQQTQDLQTQIRVLESALKSLEHLYQQYLGE